MQPMNISGSSEELFLILCVLLAMSYAPVPPCMPLWSAHCYFRNGASSTSKGLEYSHYKAHWSAGCMAMPAVTRSTTVTSDDQQGALETNTTTHGCILRAVCLEPHCHILIS